MLHTPRPLRVALAVAAVATVAVVTPVPAASASTTQTASCTDGGGHLWKARTTWEGLYAEGDGVQRVADNDVSFTTAAADATTVDYTVTSYDGSGDVVKAIAASDRSFDFDGGGTSLKVDPRNPPSAPGRSKIVLSVGDGDDGARNCSVTFVQPSTTTTAASPQTQSPLTTLPAQPATLAYGGTSGVSAYAHPGALVVAGRDNYGDQAFKDVSAAGGTVLIYLDPVIDASYGRYHELLNQSSECGPATSRWPGGYRASEWGNLNDFRPGSVVQDKLECVLEKMVAENPHMGGWFLDDVGSRAWFPGFSWDSFPDKSAYRAGAIALTQTMRKVADEHGLVFMVNGTWAANDGGGYPDASKTGNALADGAFVEHHDGELSFFGPYGCASQWADQSAVTRGKAFNFTVTNSAEARREYASSGCYAFVSQQSGYDVAVAPWGGFHPTGLPSRVTG